MYASSSRSAALPRGLQAYAPPLARLIESFQALPGIGAKTAQRLAFHVLKQPDYQVEGFSKALLEAKHTIVECGVCFNWATTTPCELCAQPNRSPDRLGIVAYPEDVFALERSGEFPYRYHVLHGLISPLDGLGPSDLRIAPLIERCRQLVAAEEPLKEVVLAISPSIEGDTTSLYITQLLKPLGLNVSRIAFGLPVGGELDYADQLTIARALAGRQSV
ncbi:MAG: recombination mediator RecR [Vampirovibrionales bacterium]|nr:recombination mediator RecR [Vampirovibrionales bacterium]